MQCSKVCDRSGVLLRPSILILRTSEGAGKTEKLERDKDERHAGAPTLTFEQHAPHCSLQLLPCPSLSSEG